jgi:HK97 family phage portal protein
VGILRRAFERKFTPADGAVNWARVETLIHGPGATDILAGPRGGDANSAVFACLLTLGMSYPEPPLRAYRVDRQGTQTPLPDHPLSQLLDRPTPRGELPAEALWFWVAWAKFTDGNAYLLKVRSGDATRGNVVQLWPLSPALVRPVTEDGSGDWVSFYEYMQAPGKPVALPIENVVHFRLGVDERDHRLGLSPLKRLVRHLSTDEEADKFTDALLKNYAVPGLVVVVKDKTLTQSSAQEIKDRISQQFGSDRRGNIAVLNNEASVSQFGFSPQQLDMQVLHRIPEERISAVLRVPAIVAGLGAGLDRATYANFKEAREAFTESTLVPSWRFDAAILNAQLVPDFGGDRSIVVAHDLTNVRALQEDEDKKYQRLNLGVQGMRPWISVNEARADIGLPPVDGGDDLTPRQPALPPPGAGSQQGQDNQQNGPQQEERRSVSITNSIEAKANGSILAQFPELLQAMVEQAAPAFERDIERHLDGTRRRVTRRLAEQMPAGNGRAR